MPLRLIAPTIALKKSYLAMYDKWAATGEKMIPFVLRYEPTDFEAFIQLLEGFSQGIGVPEGFTPHSTFWLVDGNDEVLGVSNMRHELNEKLMLIGGHIGYGICPNQRKKGYATRILEMTLGEAKKRGLQRVLLTCYSDNIASAKTIVRNGGKLENRVLVDGLEVERYWIDVI